MPLSREQAQQSEAVFCYLQRFKLQEVTLRLQVTQERGQGHRELWTLLVRDDSESLLKIRQYRTEP